MFECNKCDKKFERSRHLRLHFARHHIDPDLWTDQCDVCGKKYADAEILLRHKATHASEKIKCLNEDCKKTFSSTTSMQQHHRSFHLLGRVRVLKKKEYSCAIEGCEKSFSKHHLLKQHSYEHTGIPPFKCGTCNKRFLTQTHCNRHIKTHAGYKCDKCDEVCVTWSALRSHVSKAHPKLYKCEKCEREYKSLYQLKKHEETHQDKRLVYKCNQCDRSYTKKSNLKSHVDVFHLGLKSHSCDICHKPYAHKHSLIKHLKTHQPDYTKT